MGNINTNVNLNPYFENAFVERDDSRELIFEIDVGHDTTKYFRYFEGELSQPKNRVVPDTDDSLVFKWKPDTHMRDFQVFEKDGYVPGNVTSRGQGVGIIVIEQCRAYIKLYWEEETDENMTVGVHLCGMEYETQERSREVIVKDLTIGYDILWVRNEESFHLCEERDERDERECTVIIEHYRRYTHFVKQFPH